MSENHLEEINNLIVTEFSKTAEMFGLSPSEARLFAILYLEGSAMTLDQMSEALGKSKTSISTGIRSLLELNLVERVWKKGVRKDLYMADENLYKKFMNSYIHKWLNATTRQEHSLLEIQDKLNKESKFFKDDAKIDEASELYDKLKVMIAFHQLIEKSFKEIHANYF
ncbi:GbsR/MarR family transcriptional regulator [Aquibacillus sediminis]|uniref:GbsR/MarR family transcriptional regulator n=1 Tax=Aquibacillus sediminis TaxID=2574734 RepID=UPI00110867CC|nr:MarR family transcriptional regulator [Aquibacillus sediminis]